MDLFGKQHAANLRARTWDMKEFEDYFGAEEKKKGNSAEFQKVAEALKELNSLEPSSGPAWTNASDKLMTACQAYADSHKEARSAGGRERLAVVESLSNYQFEKNRQHASGLRDRQWSLEELGDYIHSHEALAASSPEFQAVSQAFGELVGHQNDQISLESAMEVIKASDKLKKACQEFSESKKDSLLASDQEYLGFIESLSSFHESMNLDQARDMRVVEENKERTWGQVGKFKVAEMVLDGSVATVGANVSQRLKVEHEGRKGFFTERFDVRSQGQYLKVLIEEVDRTKDPGLRRSLEENQERLLGRLKEMEISDDSIPMAERLKFNAANNPKNRVACCIGEYWNQMEEDQQKQSLGQKLIGNNDALMKVAEIVKGFQENAKDTMTADQKSGLMERMIRENLGKEDKDLKKILTGNKDFLMGVPSPVPGTSPERNMEQFFKLSLIQAKAADPNARPLDRLIEDEKGIRKFTSTVKASRAAETSEVGGFKVDQGAELTSRNIASSRVADLLGIGHIIAHSEKMIIRSGDTVMTGCFMEQAVGLDARSESERVMRQFDQLEMKNTAGFIRDSQTLEVLDYLCAQNDRHGGNMFYQLSAPDENGKRYPIGMQGIDNDLAFGNNPKQLTRGHTDYKNTVFIDKSLAEKIEKLDRGMLEYAIGDLIPKNQIDLMMDRVQLFQEHLKDMIHLEPDQWDLKEHSIDEDENKLTGKDKIYVEGLKRLDKSLHGKYEWDAIHKNGQLTLEANRIQRERANKPKVALSFDELQSRERRDALKRNPKMQIGQRREKQATVEAPQKQERQAAGPHR